MSEKITIIGAGIGGLTAALYLKKNGMDVQVYEGASEIKPVGAGILIANNAMQVYQQLGIHNQIAAAGNKISYMNISDVQLRPISEVNLTPYEKQYGVHNVAIHRGELQRILAENFGYEHIKLSKNLINITKNNHFQLEFEDKTTVETQWLIGADGLKSVVRNLLFEKSALRNAQQKCWRGICTTHLPSKFNNQLNEAWGKGKRFGFVKISENKIYWYALINSSSMQDVDTDLKTLFSEFHNDILEIIAATTKEQIIFADIMDLEPIPTWHQKGVCLVGDAAHATTPNLGQGACQAIEDAHQIGKLLTQGLTLDEVFAQYEANRKKKALAIVNASWRLGKIAQWENPVAVGLRYLAFRLSPKTLNDKQLKWIFKLN